MQSIVLNTTGQFAIIQNNDAIVNALRIRNFHDEMTGVGQIIKEFSWSKDKSTWSYWTLLTQDNLLALSNNNLLPKEGFYINFRYTLASVGNMTISDVGIDIEYDVVDANKGYVPYGYKIGNMNCVKCGSIRGQLLNNCTPTFNPYMVNPAIDIYKDIIYGVQNMFGHQVYYMRAKPQQHSGDVAFKEWTLYNVEDAVCTKVLVPNNEFPDAKLAYNPFGIDYEAPFEIHIVKQNFEEQFGNDAAPQSRDIIFFPFMPNRLYEIKSSTPHRDFMMQFAYWKVDLMIYNSKADTYATDSVNKMLEEITNDSYKAFGEELEKTTKDIVKPQQYDRLIGTNLKDPIRKYIDQQMMIFSQKIENHATDIADHYYDLSSVFDPTKNVMCVEYAIKSNFKAGDNFSFSCWFKDTKPKINIPEDATTIISVLNNIVKIQLQAQRNYTVGSYIQIARQGKLNFYGKIVSKTSNTVYDIEVPTSVIDSLNVINTNWSISPGWYSKRCFEKIFINGTTEIEDSESSTGYRSVGWKISMFAERYFIATFNGTETYFCLPENLINTWSALFFNYTADFAQMNLSLWKIKETRHQTTELDVVFTETVSDVFSVDLSTDTEYMIPASNMLLTNVRVFNEIVEFEKQSLMLNQNIVRDAHQLIIADNAYPITNIPFVGNVK